MSGEKQTEPIHNRCRRIGRGRAVIRKKKRGGITFNVDNIVRDLMEIVRNYDNCLNRSQIRVKTESARRPIIDFTLIRIRCAYVHVRGGGGGVSTVVII